MLLTRPPLSKREQALFYFARLACIRHAASVRPEPGSNSPYKIVWFSSINSLLTGSTFLWILAWLLHCSVFKDQGYFSFFSLLFHPSFLLPGLIAALNILPCPIPFCQLPFLAIVAFFFIKVIEATFNIIINNHLIVNPIKVSKNQTDLYIISGYNILFKSYFLPP